MSKITIDFKSTNERCKVVKLMEMVLDLNIALNEYVEICMNLNSGNLWLIHYE